MSEGPVVCDTGPLIALSLIDHLHILPRLYSQVVAPRAVLDEVAAGGPDRPGCAAILRASWLAIVEDVQPELLLAAELGAGEAAVIACAHKAGAQLALIDDRKARRIAAGAYKLRVKGSAGILVMAKRAELISAVRPLLDAMATRGYYLSSRVVAEATRAAGEGDDSPAPR